MAEFKIIEADHRYLLLNIKELAALHTQAFTNKIWNHEWVDFPAEGKHDSLSYLLSVVETRCLWFIAIDESGLLTGVPNKIIGCGLLDKPNRQQREKMGLVPDFPKQTYYFSLYFNDMKVRGKGIAAAIIRKRIEYVQKHGGKEIWVRTLKNHAPMNHLLTKAGFEPKREEEVEETGQMDIRVWYQLLLSD